MSARPQPRPGVLADRGLCARQERARRASPRSTSSPRTRRRSARRRRRSRRSRACEPSRALSGRLGDAAARGDRAPSYGLDPARIVCGAGSDELLSLIDAAPMSGRATRASSPTHGFLVYRIAILAAGGTPVVAPEKDLTADVDAILAKVTARTKIVFLANPNNPTGTYLPFDEVQAPARRAAAARAPRARRGLCRICPPQRLRGRPRARRHRPRTS